MIDFSIRYGEIFSIVMYLIPPLLSLLILFFANRKLIWLSVPITIIVDLLVWGKVILYPAYIGLVLLFLVPQVIITATISFVVLYISKRRKQV